MPTSLSSAFRLRAREDDRRGLHAPARLFLVLVSLALANAPGQVQAQSGVDAALAEARPLMAARQYDGAFAVCERAVATTPSAQLFRCMALASNGAGRLVDAERYATLALAVPNDPWLISHRAELEAMRAELRRRLGRLDVQSPVDGALVRIDGVEVGRTPLPEAPVVREGSHRVELTADGFEPRRLEVVVEGTDPAIHASWNVTRLDVELQRVVPSPEEVARTAPPLDADAQRDRADERAPLRKQWWLWASVGVVAAVLIAVPIAATRDGGPGFETGTGGGVFMARTAR